MTFDKVEPIPVVGVAPDSDPVTYLGVNTQWVEILVGLVEKAMWLDFWDGTDEQKKQAVSHVSQLAGLMVGGLIMANQVCTIVERSTSDGGSAVVGWQTRQLTSVEGSPSWCALNGSGPMFRPDAGDYYIEVSAPSFRTGNSIVRLYSPSTPFVILDGESNNTAVSDSTVIRLTLAGFFTADGNTDFYIRQYCSSAKPNNGLGWAPAGGINGVHTRVTLWRLSD